MILMIKDLQHLNLTLMYIELWLGIDWEFGLRLANN